MVDGVGFGPRIRQLLVRLCLCLPTQRKSPAAFCGHSYQLWSACRNLATMYRLSCNAELSISHVRVFQHGTGRALRSLEHRRKSTFANARLRHKAGRTPDAGHTCRAVKARAPVEEQSTELVYCGKAHKSNSFFHRARER
eukprot:1183584-Prorocentrum_minimum.AAC.1